MYERRKKVRAEIGLVESSKNTRIERASKWITSTTSRLVERREKKHIKKRRRRRIAHTDDKLKKRKTERREKRKEVEKTHLHTYMRAKKCYHNNHQNCC